MINYIFKRISLLLLTLIVIFVLTFFLLQLIPGYPAAVSKQIENFVPKPGDSPDAARLNTENILRIHHMDINNNALDRFWIYLSNLFGNGTFGYYHAHINTPIQEAFLKPMKYTFMIAGPSFVFGTLLGLVFGFWAGYKRGKLPDVVLNIFAIIFVAIPSFVLAILLLLFGSKFGWPIDFKKTIGTPRMLFAALLPIFVLTVTSFATLTYYVRNEVVEVLTSNYIVSARAKGASETRILFKHVFRNVSIPMVTIILPRFVSLIMGSLIIEMFFNVPGSAHVFAGAVRSKEKDIILFSILFFTSLSLLVQIMVDVIYSILDPRVIIVKKTSGNILTRKIIKIKKEKIVKEGNND